MTLLTLDEFFIQLSMLFLASHMCKHYGKIVYHCIMQFQEFDWLSGQLVYEPLYHTQVIVTIKYYWLLVVVAKQNRQDLEIFIPLALVGYEMIIANSALRASLAIDHVILNAHSWNNNTIVKKCHMYNSCFDKGCPKKA